MSIRHIVCFAAILSVLSCDNSASSNTLPSSDVLLKGEYATQVFAKEGDMPLDLTEDGTAFSACLPEAAKGTEVKAYFDLNLKLRSGSIFPDRPVLQLEWRAKDKNGNEHVMINYVNSSGMPSERKHFASESRTLRISEDSSEICFRILANNIAIKNEIVEGDVRNFQIHLAKRSSWKTAN